MKTYGPYSTYQLAGNLVFTAGQIGSEKGIAPKTISEQTKLAIKNLEIVLKNAGLKLENVIKTTIFLVDIKHYDDINKVYAGAFVNAKSQPARSTVAVKELPRVADNPLLIEIEAIAYKDNK